MKRSVLKILAGLIVFSLTVPVFAKNSSKKVSGSAAVSSFTVDDLVKFGRKDITGGSMSQRLLKEIRQNDILKDYIKKNKIYTAEKVSKNFEEILEKAIKGKEKLIKENKEKIGRMDEKGIKKEFKKDMKASIEYFKKVLDGKKKVLDEKVELGKNIKLTKTQLKDQIKKIEDAMKKCSGRIFEEYKKGMPRYLKDSLAQHKKDMDDLKNLKKDEASLGFAKGMIGALFKNNKNFVKTIKEIVN